MPHQSNATPAVNAFLDKALPEEHPARAEAIRQGACRVCLQVRPECLSSECPTGPRCHYRELAEQRHRAIEPSRCEECHGELTEFGHCALCHPALQG